MADQRRPTSIRRPISVVAAVAVAVAAGVVLVARLGVDEVGGPSSTDPPPASTSPPDPPATTVPGGPDGPGLELAVLSEPMPLAARVDPAVVWTGSRLVVWGGVSEVGPFDRPVAVRNDGAALDLDTGRWQVLAASPFPDRPDQLPGEVVAPQGVATGDGVVIVSGGLSASWDPATDSWRTMDPAPGEVGPLWSDGREVFSARANARLDLATGRWRSLPEPPMALTDAVSAWTGDELVVVGMVSFEGPAAQAYDPGSDTWRVLPDRSPGFGALGSGSVLSGGWDGERVLVHHGGTNQVLAYDPVADRWDELPRTLGRGIQSSPATVTAAADRPLLLLADTMVLLDGDRWRTVPYGWVEGGSIVDLPRLGAVRGPGGSTVLILAADPTAGQVVVLAMDVLAVSEQRRIVVGSITVGVPDPYSVSRLSGRGADQPSTVHLEDGLESCSVMAGAIDDQVTSIGPEVVVDHGGDQRTWTRHPQGGNWLHFDDDLGVAVSCADPAVSRQLVESIRFTGSAAARS